MDHAMKKINLVFDDAYDDADILFVQNEFCEDIQNNMNLFQHWVFDRANGCIKTKDGKELCCVETEDLIRWLNVTFGNGEVGQARIIKQHTQYDPRLLTVEL